MDCESLPGIKTHQVMAESDVEGALVDHLQPAIYLSGGWRVCQSVAS